MITKRNFVVLASDISNRPVDLERLLWDIDHCGIPLDLVLRHVDLSNEFFKSAAEWALKKHDIEREYPLRIKGGPAIAAKIDLLEGSPQSVVPYQKAVDVLGLVLDDASTKLLEWYLSPDDDRIEAINLLVANKKGQNPTTIDIVRGYLIEFCGFEDGRFSYEKGYTCVKGSIPMDFARRWWASYAIAPSVFNEGTSSGEDSARLSFVQVTRTCVQPRLSFCCSGETTGVMYDRITPIEEAYRILGLLKRYLTSYRSLFTQFKGAYEGKIRESTSSLHDAIDRPMWDSHCQQHDNDPSEELTRSIDRTVDYELAFAKRILNALEQMPEEKVIYWDLDTTVLFLAGKSGTSADIIRPAAQHIIQFLKARGYEHGIYTYRPEETVREDLQHPNKLNSVAQYISPELVRSARKTQREQAMSRADAFLHDVDRGILIDDDLTVRRLHDKQRGICCSEDTSDYLLEIAAYIKTENLPVLFGDGI